jgi:hypothetical protein
MPAFAELPARVLQVRCDHPMALPGNGGLRFALAQPLREGRAEINLLRL